MPEFSKQSARPLSAEHYRRAAVRAKELAAIISLLRDPQTDTERAQLTRAIHDLAMHARRLSAHHRAMSETPE